MSLKNADFGAEERNWLKTALLGGCGQKWVKDRDFGAGERNGLKTGNVGMEQLQKVLLEVKKLRFWANEEENEL